MSASGGTKAIIAAFLANAGIAVTKFIAWALSGSSSMLAEGVHSVADAGNQLLLLVGGRKSRKQADAEHPFGYGRERSANAIGGRCAAVVADTGVKRRQFLYRLSQPDPCLGTRRGARGPFECLDGRQDPRGDDVGRR